MKRIIVLLATLLLSFGLTYAGGNATLEVKVATGANAWSGMSNAFQFWIANDVVMGGLTIPFAVTTTGPVTFVWEGQPPGPTVWGVSKYVTNNPASRLNAPLTQWDLMGGLFVTELYLPDSIIIGAGTGMSGTGLPAGASDNLIQAHFKPTVTPGNEGTICLNLAIVGTGFAEFVFTDAAGSAMQTDFLNDNPEKMWCFPVSVQPNACPAFAGTNPNAFVPDINHCGTGEVTLTVTDLESNPAIFSVEGQGALTGAVTLSAATATSVKVKYDPIAMAETGTITIGVRDEFHAQACNTHDLAVTVVNNAPVADCGLAIQNVPKGALVERTFTATDPDPCDNSPVFSIVSATPAPVNAPVLSGTGNKDFSWQTAVADAGKSFVFVIEVTDGNKTDQCEFTINVLAFEGFQVVIEKTEKTLQGHYADVKVSFLGATRPIGGFDLLIGYDASALNFISASLSDDLKACKWEYFTYRYNWNGNCGNGCPSGLLRLVGLAETNNGANHPTWVDCLDALGGKDIAVLKFYVSNDRSLECQYAPIRFYWMDCTDNTMSDPSGDSLYMARWLYNFESDDILDSLKALNYGLVIDPEGVLWPGFYGYPADCFVGHSDLHPDIKTQPIKFIDFINGGIDIECADSIDARGDINLNGVANEVADAVMYTNYFIKGLTAFLDHKEGSIAASDVNADGIALTVGDLVYLVRVIVGDALPYAKPVPGASFDVATQVLNGNMTVKYNASVDAGAALLIFNVNGTTGTPVLNVPGMDMAYGINGNELRVLVYNIGSQAIPSGAHDLVTIPVAGTIELVRTEVADFNGGAMATSSRSLPSEYALNQNYPNPFNPTTTISLSLPVASDWTVAIYNVAGQMVTQYNGTSEAGVVNVVWDGKDNSGSTVASGIYFYKAAAANFSATKKMVLMK